MSIGTVLATSVMLITSADAGGFSSKIRGSQSNHDPCTIEPKKGDLVSQGRPLIVSSRAQDAIVVETELTLKNGASVDDALAINGAIVIEAGAEVRRNVVALESDVIVRKGARIAKDVVVLGGRLKVEDGADIGGEKISLSIDIGGFNLGQKLVDEILGSDRRCRIGAEK